MKLPIHSRYPKRTSHLAGGSLFCCVFATITALAYEQLQLNLLAFIPHQPLQKECYMLKELISNSQRQGGMQKVHIKKYQPFPPIDLPDRQWPSRTITTAPTWCSVDLRDGNQALPIPMGIKEKLRMFQATGRYRLQRDRGWLSIILTDRI